MENCRMNTFLNFECLREIRRGVGAGGDNQYFVGLQIGQVFIKPVDPWIELGPLGLIR